jgi:flagellar FliJ protein
MQNDRYYFETKRSQGRRACRKDSPIDIKQREALLLQSIIVEVERSILALDRSIEVEQERTGVRDRSHFAYSMSARAMETRRDNLKITRAALADRLSGLAGTQFAQAAA